MTQFPCASHAGVAFGVLHPGKRLAIGLAKVGLAQPRYGSFEGRQRPSESMLVPDGHVLQRVPTTAPPASAAALPGAPSLMFASAVASPSSLAPAPLPLPLPASGPPLTPPSTALAPPSTPLAPPSLGVPVPAPALTPARLPLGVPAALPLTPELPPLATPVRSPWPSPELPALALPELPALALPELPALALPELPALALPELPALASLACPTVEARSPPRFCVAVQPAKATHDGNKRPMSSFALSILLPEPLTPVWSHGGRSVTAPALKVARRHRPS